MTIEQKRRVIYSTNTRQKRRQKMGMSIDEAIKHLSTYSSTMGSGQTTQAQHEESKRIAKETMSKYQKIRDKISTIYVGYRHGYEVMADVMEILREVEDGND